MRKMLVAAALILAGIGAWAASSTHARVTTPTAVQIDPFQTMVKAKNLPIQHYDDYSLVFPGRGS